MSNWFTIEFGRDDETHDFINNVYDDRGDLVAEYIGQNAGDVFKHALHDYWPLLFAQLFPDYFEWAKDHETERIEE